jgi:hypothetical protein
MGYHLYVQVDLFFYREPEEAKQQDEEEPGAAQDYHADYSGGGALTEWPGPDTHWSADAAQQPISAVPGIPATWATTPEQGRTKLLFFFFFGFCLLKYYHLNFISLAWHIYVIFEWAGVIF